MADPGIGTKYLFLVFYNEAVFTDDIYKEQYMADRDAFISAIDTVKAEHAPRLIDLATHAITEDPVDVRQNEDDDDYDIMSRQRYTLFGIDHLNVVESAGQIFWGIATLQGTAATPKDEATQFVRELLYEPKQEILKSIKIRAAYRWMSWWYTDPSDQFPKNFLKNGATGGDAV